RPHGTHNRRQELHALLLFEATGEQNAEPVRIAGGPRRALHPHAVINDDRLPTRLPIGDEILLFGLRDASDKRMGHPPLTPPANRGPARPECRVMNSANEWN